MSAGAYKPDPTISVILVNLADLLTQLRQRLSLVSDTPGLDAQVLLAHVLGRPRAWLLSHPEAHLTPDRLDQLELAVCRLEQNEPLPYVLGHWEFFGLDFTLTPDVLIPRPETELLVERALSWLLAHPDRRLAADVGTGSGCIAVSLAVKVPNLRFVATDLSLLALRVAQRNAQRHAFSPRLDFIACDLLAALSPLSRIDLICANLPYIPATMLPALDVSGREPVLALDGGRMGLDVIRRLLPQARRVLRHGGLLLLEIEASQGQAVQALAREVFPHATVQLLTDLAGHDRLVEVRQA